MAVTAKKLSHYRGTAPM